MSAAGQPVRVLVVDDSPLAGRALTNAIEDGSGRLTVVGVATNGREALRLRERLNPDIVTMDVCLGSEDGVELAARMMFAKPLPILVVTGSDPKDPKLAFRAIQAGALDILPKPVPLQHARGAMEHARLRQVLVALAAVPLVTRRQRPALHTPQIDPRNAERAEVIVMGASTGGPPQLQSILSRLPQPFAAPIALVQHIADGFVENLASWLESTTGQSIRVCHEEAVMQPGVVYLAPSRRHLRLVGPALLRAEEGPERGFQRPSIDELFESAARQLGPRACGVLLTGMGRDGAEGLLAMRQRSALTIAQHPSTCVVDGMPSAAIAAGAASLVLAPEKIPSILRDAIAVPMAAVPHPSSTFTSNQGDLL